MHSIFNKISAPFVYGPLTQEEVDTVHVPMSLVPEPDGFYIGTHQEMPDLESKKVFKWVPPTMSDG